MAELQARTYEWPLQRPRLSASAIGTFLRCPEQFRRGYVLDEWGPSSPTSVVGNAMHGALERSYRWRLATGELLTQADLDDAYTAAWVVELATRDVWWRGATPDTVRDSGRPLLQLYHDTVAPGVEAVAVEEWFELRIAGLPIPVVGKLDVRTPTAVVDVKAGKSVNSQVQPHWRVQGLIYQVAAQLPVEYHSCSWGGHPYKKPAKKGPTHSPPQVRTPSTLNDDGEPYAGLRLPFTAERFAVAHRLVRNAAAGIVALHDRFGPDQPWPGSGLGHTWACGVCTWRDLDCPWWRDNSLAGGLLDPEELAPVVVTAADPTVLAGLEREQEVDE
jgi:hypothetical protein